jgi:hypothetical protein
VFRFDATGSCAGPRSIGRATFEAVESPPGTQEGFLNGVFGLERRGKHSVAVPGELAAMLLEMTLELAGSNGGR